MSKRIPCPDPECEDGVVYVCNAYAEDPLKPERRPCELCFENGFVYTDSNDAVLLN